jgi:hypothetical protein
MSGDGQADQTGRRVNDGPPLFFHSRRWQAGRFLQEPTFLAPSYMLSTIWFFSYIFRDPFAGVRR